MATRLEGVTTPVDVGDVLLDCMADTFGYDRVLLAAAPDGGALTVMSHRGDVGAEHGAYVPAGDSVLARAAETHAPQLVSHLDPGADPWLAEVLPAARNLVAMPLFAEGHSIGVLVVEHDLRSGSRIDRRVVDMLGRFASHGTLALRNACCWSACGATPPRTGSRASPTAGPSTPRSPPRSRARRAAGTT